MSVCTVSRGARAGTAAADRSPRPSGGTFGGPCPTRSPTTSPSRRLFGRQTIGAVQTGTGNLTRREQSGHLRPPVHIGDDAAHE